MGTFLRERARPFPTTMGPVRVLICPGGAKLWRNSARAAKLNAETREKSVKCALWASLGIPGTFQSESSPKKGRLDPVFVIHTDSIRSLVYESEVRMLRKNLIVAKLHIFSAVRLIAATIPANLGFGVPGFWCVCTNLDVEQLNCVYFFRF